MHSGLRGPASRMTPQILIKPDVIVRRTPAGYEIEVVQGEQYLLAINSNYRNAYQQLKTVGPRNSSDEEKKHIVEFVERADLFIRNINQRRRTLRLITKAIVEYQQGYLEIWVKVVLTAVTRTRIARALKMMSPRSAALLQTNIQLPSEEIVSFDFFFDSSVSIKDLIGEIIANEDSSNPLVRPGYRRDAAAARA